MATFDDIEAKGEEQIVAFFDAHAKVARGAAWFVAGLQLGVGALSALRLDLPLGALGLLTGATIVWQLVKTRATAVALAP